MPETTDIQRLQRKLADYEPSSKTIDLVRETPIVLLVGVSGAGKDSIKQKLLATGQYHHIVSHTTRLPRENRGIPEQDGVDYHFIDLGEAESMLDSGAFVEAKLYSGNVYGTSAAEIQQARDDSKIAVTDIEVQGIAEYKAMAPNVHAIFILPPSYETWQERLQNRYEGKADTADMERRMQTARAELQEALDKDYFDFVLNENLDEAVKMVDAIAHGSRTDENAEAARALAQRLLGQL
jgi:guanylate kinase